MKKLIAILFILAAYYVHAQDTGNKYFVATWGDDLNPGTYEQPWGTWQKAFSMAEAGDSVFFRGGTYYSNSANEINPKKYGGGGGNSGTAENPIVYMSYPGEWAILDCIHHCDVPEVSYNKAISLWYVEYIILKDFEVRNVLQCDSTVTGAIEALYSRNLTFEHIILHEVGQRGFAVNSGAWLSHYEDGDTDVKPYWNDYTDTTRFINCDSYNLCDTLVSTTGNAADAYITMVYRGNYFYFEGCRAWNYSDDGFNLTNINRGEYILKNNWVMSSNKYLEFGGERGIEGNGISKMSAPRYGEYDERKLFTLNNNLAIFCNGYGFYINFNQGGTRTQTNSVLYNNSVYRCEAGYFENVIDNNPNTTIYRNNLAYNNDLYFGKPHDFYLAYAEGVTESHNTSDYVGDWPGWELTDTITVTDADFIGLDGDKQADSLYLVSLFTAPRQADGSLPAIKPLTLSLSSDLIDAGIDIGLAYNGSAPDIGAFECEIVPGTTNKYPIVTIASPTNNRTFLNSESITIDALASDLDGSITKVEFYNGSNLIGEKTTVPWSFSWVKPPVGYNSIRAVATDNLEAKATSATVNVVVIPDDFKYSDSDNCILYPNPNNGIFTLFLIDPLKKTTKVNVISADGKTVYSNIISAEDRIINYDLSFLKPGTYLFTIGSAEIFSSKIFIKQ